MSEDYRERRHGHRDRRSRSCSPYVDNAGDKNVFRSEQGRERDSDKNRERVGDAGRGGYGDTRRQNKHDTINNDKQKERPQYRARERSSTRSRSRSPQNRAPKTRGRRKRSTSRSRSRSPRWRGGNRRQSLSASRSRSPLARNRPPVADNPRHRGLVAERLPPQPPVAKQALDKEEHPPVAAILQGTVQSVRPFGVFVRVPGYRRDILVHNTQVSEELQLSRSDEDEMKVKALEFYAPQGSQVWVKVTEVSGGPGQAEPRAGGGGGGGGPGGGGQVRVNGSMKVVSQEDGSDLDPEGGKSAPTGPQSDEPPEEGSIHKAVVKRIEPYGVFVALHGYKRFGLVHSSQVSSYLSFSRDDKDEEKKSELASIVTLGETVWVKVVEVRDDPGGRGPKISCSMKLVSQTDGSDLDPGGARYLPRGGGEGEGPGGGRGAPIGASAGKVAGGKVDWGYLAADKVKAAGVDAGVDYGLLESDEEERELRKTLRAAGAGQAQAGPQSAGGDGSQLPLPPPPPLPGHISSVEEALAIIEALGSRHKNKKSKKKHKKEKDADKSKNKKLSKRGKSSKH